MPATRPIRVGIAGANPERGWARDAHIPALKALAGDYVISAVSARTREIADSARTAFGASQSFDDSLALARDPSVDLVAVTVKVPEHRAIVLEALAAGKHVYCEWPLGRDLDEAQEMAAAVTPASHAMIGLQALSAPACLHARALVAAGEIGRLTALRVYSPTAGWGSVAPAHYAYLQDKRNGATLETIAGGHTLALLEFLAGPYEELDARCSILRPLVSIAGSDETLARTCADHMLVLGRHRSGCLSTLEVAGGEAERPFSLELQGEAGWLRISGGFPGGFQGGRLKLTTSAGGDIDLPDAAPQLEGPPVNLVESYRRFAADIRDDTRTVADFSDAVALTRLLETLDRASAGGQRQCRAV